MYICTYRVESFPFIFELTRKIEYVSLRTVAPLNDFWTTGAEQNDF